MTNSEFRFAHHPDDVKKYTTKELREHFLIPDVFVKDEINLTYTMYDRYIAGGAFPVSKALKLEPIDDLKAQHFFCFECSHCLEGQIKYLIYLDFFFVGPLEAFSEFTRILSFTFRLFGNMTAGEIH